MLVHPANALRVLFRGLVPRLGPMMTRTSSETYFENLCFKFGIPFRRISKGTSKTPDYELTIDGQTIVSELKQIALNKSERRSRGAPLNGKRRRFSTSPKQRLYRMPSTRFEVHRSAEKGGTLHIS